MIIKYDYLTIKVGKGFQVLDYVFEEMSDFGGPIFKEFVEKVIYGKSELERIGANMCYMDIKKDYTLIYPTYDFDDSNQITIEIKYLLKLIDLW